MFFLGCAVKLLGRCISCVSGKRSSKQCREKWVHTCSRATPCLECVQSNIPVTTCRAKLKHKKSNGLKFIAVPEPGKQGFPDCCRELSSFQMEVHVSQDPDVQLQNKSHSVGYLLHYTPAQWEKWFEKFWTWQGDCRILKHAQPVLSLLQRRQSSS